MTLPRFLLLTPFVLSGLIGVFALANWLAVPVWLVVGTCGAVGLWLAVCTEIFEHRAGAARRPTKLDRRY